MVTANTSRESISLLESAKLYDTVNSIVEAYDSRILGISLSEVNGRLLKDVSTSLTSPLDSIRSELDEVLQTVKDVGNDIATVPITTTRELSSMSARLKVDTISTIPSRVKILLANFQNAVEDPKSLYPRLICCDLPIDPAKVVNFARRHQLLDQILQQAAFDEDGNRSMPSAPKSAIDVITNVNSSLESISDLLCESVNDVSSTSERFGAIQNDAKNLASISRSVDDAMHQQEEIRGVFDRISSLLCQENKDSSVESDDVGDNQDAMYVVRNASSLIERLSATCFSEDLVPQFQDVKRLLSDFVKKFTALLSRAKEAVLTLVSTLCKFIRSLPRIAKELRQFFVPTGFQALILKPSPDLMSLLQSVDDLRTVLPEPSTIESASDGFEPDGVPDRVRSLLDKFGQLDIARRKLFESIENQNLLAIISEVVEETLRSILRNMQSSAANILDAVDDNIDSDDVIRKLRKITAFGSQKFENSLERRNEGPAGLVENVTGAGGLFGKLFET